MSDEPAISPDLAALWYERIGHLRGMLREEPDGQWAWLWRLRLQILEYLAGRYGAGATGADLCDAASSTPPREPLPETSRSHPPTAGRTTGDQASSHGSVQANEHRSDHRVRLQRLHGINEEVRKQFPITSCAPREYVEAMALYQRARDAEWRCPRTPPPVNRRHLENDLSYPETGHTPTAPNAPTLQDEERAIIDDESKAIAALVSRMELFDVTDAPLNEDEIAALLSGGQPG